MKLPAAGGPPTNPDGTPESSGGLRPPGSPVEPWSEDPPVAAASGSPLPPPARPAPSAGAGSTKGTPTPRSRAIARPWWLRAHLPLVLLVVAFTVGYFVACWIRFQALYDTNWDLGINMQALWSTTHGSVLYEAGDYETTGVKSLLSIHSTYIAIPVAYLYALIPGPGTLFAIQAAVVASSAVPLYLIGRKGGLTEAWLIGGLAVYLLTFTISSAILYDFHWEAFIPAEFAWTYYLWTQRRYALAFVPAVLGVLTLEVFPFLLVGLVLYFAYHSVSRRFFSHQSESSPASSNEGEGAFSRTWPLLGLLIFALVSYVVLRVLQHDVVPMIVGTTPSSLSHQISLGYSQLFGITATSQTLPPSLVYWFLLFAAFGFIPLLVRQSLLLLSLPWFWASVFVDPTYASAFGNQYAFVAVATLAVAFIEGLAAVQRSVQANDTRAPTPLEWLLVVVPFFVIAVLYSTQILRPTREGEYVLLVAGVVVVAVLFLILLSRSRRAGWSRTVWHTTTRVRDSEGRVAYRQSTRFSIRLPRTEAPPPIAGLTRYRSKAGPVLVGVLVIVVMSNLALSPFSPANFQATVFPGYRFSTTMNPAYTDVPHLLANLPANATIVASDNLFPFVADDSNAYSLLFGKATGTPFLPFNAHRLPAYVLVSISEWSAVPSFLTNSIFNQSDYGLVGMIYSGGYPESIYLLESGYQGASTIYEATPFSNTTVLCPSEFDLGASGRLVAASGTACGSEIESVPAANLSGNGHTVWFGPYLTVLPGEYELTISLKGGVDAGKSAKSGVVLLNGGGYGVTSPWYSFNVDGTSLSPSSWTNVTLELNITWPVSGAEFRGYIDYTGSNPTKANGFIDLNFVQLSRIAAPE